VSRSARAAVKPSAKSPAREKGRRTQARLVEAAERVFVRDGYLGTRVADIAREAGLAHGSFYTYFDSKADVFRTVAGTVVDEMYGALDGRTLGAGASLARIQAANRSYIDLYERHAGLLALIEQVATFDDDFRAMRLDLRQRFVNRIQRAVERLPAPGDGAELALDPRVAANALGGMVDNLCYTWFVLKEPFEREEVLRALDAIWARALLLGD
jgi:AcrR family transcriptional regulator